MKLPNEVSNPFSFEVFDVGDVGDRAGFGSLMAVRMGECDVRLLRFRRSFLKCSRWALMGDNGVCLGSLAASTSSGSSLRASRRPKLSSDSMGPVGAYFWKVSKTLLYAADGVRFWKSFAMLLPAWKNFLALAVRASFRPLPMPLMPPSCSLLCSVLANPAIDSSAILPNLARFSLEDDLLLST